MAAALADLNIVKKRTIQILNANQAAYATTVSGTVGAYPYDQEIIDAIFEADEWVATNFYFQSVNDALATPFIVKTTPLFNGDDIPFHHGSLRATDVAKNTVVFTAGASNVLTTTTAHGWATGQVVSGITTGALPTGLSLLTDYYVIVLTPTTIKLASTYTNAVAGTAVSVTNGSGSGVNTLIAWRLGIEARHIDDVTNAIQVGTAYVESGAFNFLYKENSGSMYTPAPYFRLYFPEYVRISTLQARQSEEFLVICGAIKMLTKNASPAPFATYAQEFDRGGIQIIQDGQYTTLASEQAGGVA